MAELKQTYKKVKILYVYSYRYILSIPWDAICIFHFLQGLYPELISVLKGITF